MDAGHDERGGQTRTGTALSRPEQLADAPAAAVARTNTYFLSDLHLGAAYMGDRRAHEQRVCRFLRSIEPLARRLVLVGDVLDYWFEYRTVVPRGYVRFFGMLARMADNGTEIIWYTGNHDIWLFDYLRTEIGMEVVDPRGGYDLRRFDGALFCIGHGDGIGHRSPGFRFIRGIFRNRLLQKLFSGIHPRWTVPLAHAWSSHSRKGSSAPVTLPPRVRADLEVFARRELAEHPDLRYVVVGHHHVPVDEPVSPTCRLVVLGDWISHDTYAVFDGSTLRLERFADDSAAR